MNWRRYDMFNIRLRTATFVADDMKRYVIEELSERKPVTPQVCHLDSRHLVPLPRSATLD